MTESNGERIKKNQSTICYRPKGNVNADNPPQGGTGVPKKPKDNK